MTERETVVAEFKVAHDEYLHIVHENLSPDERKEMVEDSLRRYQKLLDGAETLDLEVFRIALRAIKKSKEELSFVRGTCSKDCMTQFLRMQNFIMTAAMAVEEFKKEPEIWIALLETSNSLVADTVYTICKIAEDRTKHNWQVRDEVHTLLMTNTKRLLDMGEAIKAGNVMAIRLPAVDKEKYKEFLN